MEKAIRIYFHIAKIGKFQAVVNEIIYAMIASGLYESARSVTLCIGGSPDSPLNMDWTFLGCTTDLRVIGVDIEKREFETLNILRKDAIDHLDDNFLYVHTKGVSKDDGLAIDEWRRMMTHFCVTKWQRCIDALKENSSCGIDFRTEPFRHYSGNFWWSKGSHLADLQEVEKINVKLPSWCWIWHLAEAWLCSIPGNYKSLYDCGVDVRARHMVRYPMAMYEGR